MNITVKPQEPKDGVLTAEVTIAAADVDAAIAKTYKDIAHKYQFQGFRRGHVPRPIIDGIIGKQAVLGQATNDVLNDIEPMILNELDIVPIGRIEYPAEPELLAAGTDYVVECHMDVRPDAGLTSYDAPSITMPPAEATDAEIDLQLDQLLAYQTTYEDAKLKRGVKDGDIVSVNIENVENGERFAGQNRMINLDGAALPEAMSAALTGMKAGESKDVEWADGDTTVKLTVTLNSIMKAVKPELDDELAKKSFGFDTVAELRDAVKGEIEADKARTLPGLKEDRLVEAVGKQLDLEEIPENYQNQIFQELASEFLNTLQRQGLTLDTYLGARGIDMGSFLEDLRTQAADRARQSLALDALAKHLGLTVDADEVRAEFEKANVGDVDAAIAEWTGDGRIPAIRESIKRTKALAWLVENAVVETVDEVAERLAAEKKPAKKKAAKKTTKKKAEEAPAEAPAEVEEAPAE
ncbi:MAG: trigger factor [Atopobiaceae bacterium]|nr:trigger factor [Atopobiaceae bacterium]